MNSFLFLFCFKFLSALKVLSHCYLASIFFPIKSTVFLVLSHCMLNWFSPATFKIFGFQHSVYDNLGVDLLVSTSRSYLKFVEYFGCGDLCFLNQILEISVVIPFFFLFLSSFWYSYYAYINVLNRVLYSERLHLFLHYCTIFIH